MRTTWDVYASVRQYLHQVLGDTWEVRFAEDEASFRRPYAQVEMIERGITMSGPAIHTDVTMPLTIYCYPEPGASRTEAKATSLLVQEQLHQGFLVGVERGRPRRIPLWDFAGKTLIEASSVEDGYVRVIDFDLTSHEDSDDPRIVTVVAGVRVTWRRTGRLPSWTHTVAEVRTQQLPT